MTPVTGLVGAWRRTGASSGRLRGNVQPGCHVLKGSNACLASMLAMVGTAAATDDVEAVQPKATFVYVDKSERQLFVFSGRTLLLQYPIALGRVPAGHKQQEGDKRTPEGVYMLDWKNPNSRYHRSIHVSYPNAADRADAQRRGVSPGGDIMIHGQPNQSPLPAAALQQHDWTDGCIALTDAQMDALWEVVDVPVPIRIVP